MVASRVKHAPFSVQPDREEREHAVRFTYEGFIQNGGRRNFLFEGTDDEREKTLFSICVDLTLLIQNAVPVQEAPLFCQGLLARASCAGAGCLDKFHSYQLLDEDLRPILLERAAREAKKKLQKSRTVYRKPAATSNLILANPEARRGHAV
jgi:hypothetical protein